MLDNTQDREAVGSRGSSVSYNQGLFLSLSLSFVLPSYFVQCLSV